MSTCLSRPQKYASASGPARRSYPVERRRPLPRRASLHTPRLLFRPRPGVFFFLYISQPRLVVGLEVEGYLDFDKIRMDAMVTYAE